MREKNCQPIGNKVELLDTKGGHPQLVVEINDLLLLLLLSPHLRNSAILRTTKSIVELRTKKSCGIAIADLQNLISAIPQLSAVYRQFRHFLVPFPQLKMVLKINHRYF
jgi:hypothetical protein